MEQGGFDNPADPPPPANSGGGSSISEPNFGIVKTPAGLLMVVNIILLFLCWVIMAGWRGDVGSIVYENVETGMQSFFLFTTVFPWILLIVLLVFLILGLHTRLAMINWPLTLLINCCIWAIFLLISSSIVAAKAGKHHQSVWKGDTLRAAAAFGYFSMIGLLVEAFFHFREFRSP